MQDFKLRILLKILDKQLRMQLLRKLKKLERYLRRISLFIATKMILVWLYQCTSLGHLFLCMVSKDSKEENGTTSIEVLSGFRPLRRSQLRKKLIILKINTPNSINLTSEMTCQRSQTVILPVALWGVSISLMSFLSKNTKIQFHQYSRRNLKPHSNLL